MGVYIKSDGSIEEIAPPENNLFFSFNEMREYLHCQVFQSRRLWDGNYIVFNPDSKNKEVNLIATEIALRGIHHLKNAFVKCKRFMNRRETNIDFSRHYGKYVITGNVLLIEKSRIITTDL